MSEKRIIFYDQISRNKRNSVFLIIGVLLVLILFGAVIGLAMGPSYFTIIMIITTIFSITYVTIGFYKSDKIALASVGAKPADHIKHRSLYHSVENMALASGLPMPRVYVMPGAQINAFASGRDPKNSVICVTEGAIEKLSKQELEGVIAHEMGHIANYDIRFMTLTAVLVGMIAILSQIFLRSLWFSSGRDKDKSQAIFMLIGIVLAILAPIVTYLVQMAISRKREFTADATAVKFQRTPTGLISALKKIKNDSSPNKRVSKAVAPLFISDPIRMSASGLSSTHPPIDKRISVLEKM
jgi:heat shock protein HtpX